LGIQDKKLLCIIKEMLKAPIIMPNGEKVYPNKGTPQGGILSPLLANIVLNELDWWRLLLNGRKCYPIFFELNAVTKCVSCI
jgi:retron-type reverse transcriptase